MKIEQKSEQRLEQKLDSFRFDVKDDFSTGTRIKVIGVGGGGSNAVARMYREGVGGVEFYAVNTDKQALHISPLPNKLLIGHKVTAGLGAGADPNMGKEAALEDTERIIEILEGADMVFVAAGLGGGTGTGAAPVIASLAKELNALTVAIVTKPFAFEGSRRMKAADRGLEDLAGTVDTLIQIPNQRLTSLVPKGTPLMESFRVADDVLRQAVVGISDIMNTPGLINRDFSDIKAIMSGMGHAMMGTASARGENAAVEAAKQAINCPMLEEGEFSGARGILINITASNGISLHQVDEACTLIQQAANNDDCMVNFGIVLDDRMGDEVKVTVIATGFPRASEKAAAKVEAAEESTRVAFFSPSAGVSAPAEYDEFAARHAEQEPAATQIEPLRDLQHEPALVGAGVVATNGHAHDEPVKIVDELEVPAFLRRERRGFSS
ncbi:MAG: cell division protein FtsZ [Acidobacteria bacterium]|nr:cell division protein FtsZ [Acidobacteriota bacterium]